MGIPITALPSDIQSSLTVVPEVTQVPTSLIPEGALTSIIGNIGTDLIPTAVPTSNLDPGVLTSIIASATGLPPIPSGILPSVISQVTAAPSLIVSAAPTAVP